MRSFLHSFTLAASMLLLLNPFVAQSDPLPWPNITERDNTVYVTVTEYRYIPSVAPAPNPQPPPASLAQSIDRQAPVSDEPAAPPAEHPAPSNVHPTFIFFTPPVPLITDPLPRLNNNPMPAAPVAPIASIAIPSIVPPAYARVIPAPSPNRAAHISVAFVTLATLRPNLNRMAMVPAITLESTFPAGHLSPLAPNSSPINNVPIPPVAVWTPPANDALTYTSYAGLLSTATPAFYPTPLNSVVPSPAIASSDPQQRQPHPPQSPITHSPTLPTAPTPNTVPTMDKVPTLNTPAPLTPASMPTLLAPFTKLQELSEKHSSIMTAAQSELASSTDSASISILDTITSTSTSTSTTSTFISTTTDVTVSTTTTTRGDMTTTKTTVGTDGITTVLTEYPTSTQSRGSRSTSGAQARWSRIQARQVPCVGSVFGYLTGLLISETRWSMAATAMIAALALHGAAVLLV